MGEMVTFKTMATCDGYLAGSGRRAGRQEWWGLVPHIKDVVDRFAAAGFTALAPDLYHGESSTEPDGAGKLMMALNLEQAAKDLSGAIALLQERSGTAKVGVVGYCMGGGLSLGERHHSDPTRWRPWRRTTASSRGRPRSPTGQPSPPPSWASTPSSTTSPAQRPHVRWSQPCELGKDATMHIHAGCQHAFFNDARPEVYSAEASAEAWDRTVALFRSSL
ncbi:MAG: dienelactone hydrolase family protein [Acidimicrobiaceae bacterium]|nr:dienelactone hydrolase family protein [Acidimicrobiaceae bacterium]